MAGNEQGSLQPWLELSLIGELSGTSWRKLLAAFGTPLTILRQSHATLAQVVDPVLAAAIARGPDASALAAALTWALGPQRAIVTRDDPRYPPLLRETPDPPPLLYAAGRIELLQREAIAIVGSRNASAQGMRNAETFAHALAAAGLCVVSGLALGCDAAAHRGGLGAAGSTIAVLGSGIDVVYPRRNAALLEEVLASGLVLSEFPLGTPPLAVNFPRRNRIISGLARGCLVVEAALASGSLVTARIAVDMGRDVFAIPGSIHSPLSRGCHSLIKQGAKLVETADDILQELGVPARGASAPRPPDDASPETATLLRALGHDTCDVDTLAERTGWPVPRLLAALMQGELDGRIGRNADGSYQRLT
ncbi:MAG: DNA-protecting protein DprA [Burkholderiales bacterium]|nr:DNA-protecting protein DprA [Burkholderiales bacterium]